MADVRPLRDDPTLQWPPSAADLDSVVAVSLDDDGVRQLASSLVVRTVEPRQRRRRPLAPVALAASCLVAAGGVAWWALPEPAEERPRTAVADLATKKPVLRREANDGLPTQVTPAVPRVNGDEVQRGPDRDALRAEATTLPVAAPAAISPALVDLNDARDELAAPPVEVALPLAPLDRVEIAATVPSDALSGAVPVEFGALPSRRPSSAIVPEAGTVPVEPRRANEEPAIRALLEQYGAAYSRLDARAARAVWPAVDVQALARAFEALESQDIDFERCDVQVNGTAARAACRGTSTWVPRVGERRVHRDAREWTFRLERDQDARWRIQSAAMR